MVATGAPRPRADSLPEHAEYRDTGCDAHPSCLSCPFPVCRYDIPGGVRELHNRKRDAEITRLTIHVGLTADEIAAMLGVSRRTVFRVVEVRPLR